MWSISLVAKSAVGSSMVLKVSIVQRGEASDWIEQFAVELQINSSASLGSTTSKVRTQIIKPFKNYATLKAVGLALGGFSSLLRGEEIFTLSLCPFFLSVDPSLLPPRA